MNAPFAIRHGGGPERRHIIRIGAGIAASIVLHALLLAVYRQPAAPALPPPPEPLTIRLRAPAPPPPAAPPIPEPAAPMPTPAPRTRTRAAPARPVIAVDPAAHRSAAETFAVEPAPAAPPEQDTPATTTPRFDLDAARGTARKVANAPDPDKVGTALERLPPPPLQTESRFERAIKSAKRRDCKDGVPGGLLAPIFLAMDKKDSGCKW